MAAKYKNIHLVSPFFVLRYQPDGCVCAAPGGRLVYSLHVEKEKAKPMPAGLFLALDFLCQWVAEQTRGGSVLLPLRQKMTGTALP
jgi:hypothetical protein